MNGNNSNTNLGLDQLHPDDLFEEAVARLESGESIDAIVGSYPYANAGELKAELQIVELALDVQHAPIPQPKAASRMAAKRGFLAAAADIKSREASAQAFRPVRIAEPPRRIAPATAPEPSFAQMIVESLQSILSMRTVRLAPIVLALTVVILSGSTFVAMAQSSVPGDATYSFKQWMRKQELQLTRPDRRDLVRQEQEQELAADVRKAAARADHNSAVIQAEDTQVFYGRTGRLLKIGGLTVMDRYQPDANNEIFRPMEIEGDLVPGAKVGLVYQIMPGQSDTVQGISLMVLAPPAETPTPAELPAVDMQPRDGECAIVQPEGWVEYQVAPGDNLTYIARRGGATVDDIVAANCLANETIIIGASLYVPAETLQDQSTSLTCGEDIPSGWVEYEVQVGDNLTWLAEGRGTTVEDVMGANCLDSETILIGAKLYLPAE